MSDERGDRLTTLVADAAAWRRRIDELERRLAEQAERLGEAASISVALERSEQAVRHRDLEIGRLQDGIEDWKRHGAELERRLAEVTSSLSWRATRPLRSVAARTGGLVRRLSAGAPPPSPPTLVVEASVAPPGPRRWVFVGDLIERLGRAVPGDGEMREAARFVAAVGAGFEPCAAAPTVSGLAALPLRDSAAFVAARTGQIATVPEARPPSLAAIPVPGDLVLFLAPIPSPSGRALLIALRERGVAFGALVDELPPLGDPEAPIGEWLRTALTHAHAVLLPGDAVCATVLRWAALVDIVVSASVRPAAPTLDGVAAQLADPVDTMPLEQPGRLFLPGLPPPDAPAALARAARWCTDAEPLVSIVIVNRGAARLVRAAVANIWATAEGASYEILIVDNGSPVAECRALGALGPGIRLLALDADRFEAEARNIAAEQARGSLLCLLDPHSFGQPGWLIRLAAPLQTDPTAGFASAALLTPDLQEAADGPERGGIAMVRRDDYLRAGGLDLAFEPPACSELDLQFKLRALGLEARPVPAARAVVLPRAPDPFLDLNREKFRSRWANALDTLAPAALTKALSRVFTAPIVERPDPALPSAVLYTPYALTPGGGERFLLTIAAELARDHRVTVVTPRPYSQLRLQNLAHVFGLDLGRCRIAAALPERADLAIVMGNHLRPPIAPPADDALFICQFPFPGDDAAPDHPGYRAVIAYSDYARRHIEAGFAARGLPPVPVEVVHPPVPQIAPAAGKGRMILTVGRFFAGGHNKRHDLMIEAFRRLASAEGAPVELHLAGSSSPTEANMRHLAGLMRAAEGLPVRFHVNASAETLEELYRRSAIYWHATGLGGDVEAHPELAEHFGITLAEAMGAGCVPLAFAAGGPCEIVTDGVDGMLYRSVDELVERTAGLLADEAARKRIGDAAHRRAAAFAPDRFRARIRALLGGPA